MGLVYFMPAYCLQKFYSFSSQVIEGNHADKLEKGLEYLKSHYKFIGIMTIVLIAFYFIFFLAMIITSGSIYKLFPVI